MSETQFQGFDWTELYEPLTGKVYPGDVGMTDEKHYADAIREKLNSVVWPSNPEEEVEQARVVSLCRQYVLSCAEYDGYEAPLWRGLAAIKHDESFLQYMYPLLEYIWT